MALFLDSSVLETVLILVTHNLVTHNTSGRAFLVRLVMRLITKAGTKYTSRNLSVSLRLLKTTTILCFFLVLAKVFQKLNMLNSFRVNLILVQCLALKRYKRQLVLQ